MFWDQTWDFVDFRRLSQRSLEHFKGVVLVSFSEKLGLGELNYLFRDAHLVSSQRGMEIGVTVPLRPTVSIQPRVQATLLSFVRI